MNSRGERMRRMASVNNTKKRDKMIFSGLMIPAQEGRNITVFGRDILPVVDSLRKIDTVLKYTFR